MAIDPADLIRRFEPILFFHKDELFFPSDAKRYIEHCALWSVRSAIRDNKAFWGSLSSLPHFPDIARDRIAASPDELGPAGDRVFLGSPSINLDETATLEHFLDFTGWSDSGRVDIDTDNSYAGFSSIFVTYEFTEKMKASRFWYHAEIFTQDRLRLLVDNRPKLVSDFFFKLKDPLLLCYYLFFPAHEEPLEGCGDGEFQRLWGSFAGEWACVAILLQGDGNQANYKPTHVGLTSRNAGTIAFLGQEVRIGMRVLTIDALLKIPRTRPTGPQGEQRADGEHVIVFVSKGTHGFYEAGGAQTVPAFSPADMIGQTCGKYETVSAETDDAASHAASLDRRHTVLAVKTIAGALSGLFGSGFNPIIAAGGAFSGLALGMLEGIVAYGGMADFAGIEPPLETAPSQMDQPPTGSQVKTVIGPPGIVIPGAPPEFLQTWPRFAPDENVLSTTIDNSQYSLFVGKPDDLSARPAWLPSGSKTFSGRWGNRVQHDPFNRRAGMNFPDFAGMFLDGVGM